jgi:rhomboid protease GluP
MADTDDGRSTAEPDPATFDDVLEISPEMLVHDEGPRDFELGMRYAAPFTLSIIAVLIAVFIWELATGALLSETSILGAGALARDAVFSGEVWRTMSATALHGSFDHLIGNCIALYILGVACEHAVGGLAMLEVYGASAFAGSLASMISNPGPGVGASGAIFGLMGAILVILHRHRDKIHLRDARIGVVIAAWAAYTFILGGLNPMIDNAAHLGGFVGGALMVNWRRPRLLPREA